MLSKTNASKSGTLLIFGVFTFLGGGCSGLMPGDGTPDEGNQELQITSLSLTPNAPVLQLQYGEAGQVTLQVMGQADQSQHDLSGQVTLTADNPQLVSIEGTTIKANGSQAGETTIRATFGDIVASTSFAVHLTYDQYDADAAMKSLFAAGCQESPDAPQLTYPAEDALYPANLNGLSFYWSKGNNDRFLLRVASDRMELNLYTDASDTSINNEIWGLLARAHPEEEVTISLSSASAPGGPCYTATTRKMTFARDSIEGGIYYWATSNNGAIIRYDFGKAEAQAETFYSASDTGGKCIGCHVLSRDGQKIALTFQGGKGDAGIIDVATRQQVNASSFQSTYKAFSPDAKTLVAASKGSLFLIDAETGVKKSELETGGQPATMPDISADGTKLVFVVSNNYQKDLGFWQGAIAIADLDQTGLGKVKILVEADASLNNYYPSFSPDGKWILFNRSHSDDPLNMDTYSDPGAELWVVSADGGEPVALSNANAHAGSGNSWGRWAPFRQTHQGDDLYWFTFSSIRNYGNVVINDMQGQMGDMATPQIWMSAFSPKQAAEGNDPSSAAFWLPFQSPQTNNHIAQWVERVVELK
jgi:Tol biopolymer transport system component